jgi:uncharacterized protein (DUF433 family)/DNA-binding transcriptional MerR regulator
VTEVYSTRMTSVLTGATVAQLRNWRRDPGRAHGPLLEPATGRGGAARYSFQDVVALRMFVGLRQVTSLQKIRKAVALLHREHPDTHLSAHALRAVPGGRTIVWLTEEGDYVDVVEHPGQPGIPVVMEQVFGAFTTQDGRLVPDLRTPAPGLSLDPGVRGGFPVLEGTRLPYDEVAGLVRDGLDAAEIRRIYPSATTEGIAGAREFADAVDRGMAVG